MAIKITVGAHKKGNLTWKCPSCDQTLYSYNYDSFQSNTIFSKSRKNIDVIFQNKSRFVGYSYILDEIYKCYNCNKNVIFGGTSALTKENLYFNPSAKSYSWKSVFDIHSILEKDILELEKRGIKATYYKDTAVNEFLSAVHKSKEILNFPGILALSFTNNHGVETQIYFVHQYSDGIGSTGLFARYEKGKLLEGVLKEFGRLNEPKKESILKKISKGFRSEKESNTDIVLEEKLKQLQKIRNDNLITETEYIEKKNDLLSKY